MARRDPDSPAAQAAVASLAATQAEKEQATRTLIDHGVLPGSTPNTDGTTTYYDSRTGREIATTRSWQEASLLTHSHTHFYEQQRAEDVATLANNPFFAKSHDQFPSAEKLAASIDQLKKDISAATFSEKRALKARLADEEYNAGLISGMRSHQLTPDEAQEKLAAWNKSNEARDAGLAATRKFSSPENATEVEKDIGELDELAGNAGMFGMERVADWVKDALEINEDTLEKRQQLYQELLETTAKKYNLYPEELNDVLRHRHNAQELPVSRDALGTIYIKNEVQFQGVEAIVTAVRATNLPATVQDKLIAQAPAQFAAFKKNLILDLESNYPDLQAELGISSDHIDESFEKFKSALNHTATSQGLLGANVAFARSAAAVELGFGLPEWWLRGVIGSDARDFLGIEEKPWLVRRSDTLTRQANAAQDILNFSHQFDKKNVEILGADAGVVGQAIYTTGETIVIGALTGPMAPVVTAERIAQMGASAERIALTFNALSKAAPLSAVNGLRRGIGVYEQAQKMGLPDEQCTELAVKSGLIDAATNLFFAGAGAPTVESLATGARQAALRSTLETVFKNTAGQGALALGKGVTAQAMQAQLSHALDTAFVQLKLNPDMTVEELGKSWRETAVSTLFTAVPVSAVHSMKTFLETRKSNNALRARPPALPPTEVTPAPPSRSYSDYPGEIIITPEAPNRVDLPDIKLPLPGEETPAKPTKPATPDEESPTKPATPEKEATTKPTNPGEETTTKPANPDEEVPTKPATPDEEAPAKPASPDEEAPTKPASPDEEASTKPAAPDEEAPIKPAAPDEEAPSKPTSPDEEAPAKPITPDEAAPAKPATPGQEIHPSPLTPEQEIEFAKATLRTGSDEIPHLVLGDGTHDPSHPAAARLRAGESPATVLHDELRHLTRQANEQGHLPLADCVEILKAADQIGAAHAAREGTPHEPLLPENFHRLPPEEQAALLQEKIPALVRSQILPDPQAPANRSASQKLRDLLRRVGGHTAGKFTTFVSAARERFRRSMEHARNQATRSGEELTGESIDYVKNTGVLGGKLATTRQIQAAQKELAGYGIRMDRRFSGKGGGFAWDVETPYVSFMKYPTEIQLFHELTHVRQFQKLGREGYRKLGAYAREAHVFNQIWKSRRSFNNAEILDAIDYIRKIRSRVNPQAKTRAARKRNMVKKRLY